MNLPLYIDKLQQHGSYSFTKLRAQRETGESDPALKLALWRLARKRRIVPVREGFYVIVPLEYASSEMLPPEWFIDDMMKFLQQPYYVGLLSAAAVHGAAHQQPQEFHVVVQKASRNIRVGRLFIRFFAKATLQTSAIERLKTPTGYMHVATPAVTALDLVTYASRVGGFERVATVLQELGEKLTAPMLIGCMTSTLPSTEVKSSASPVW
jgi:predicted transcriptional regulator of viral defense system